MAPAPTYATPVVQLAELFRCARERGWSFERFWSTAVREGQPLVMTNHPSPPPDCVRWPTDRNDRVGWQQAICGTRETWERVYAGLEPTLRERAVGVLGDSIGVLARVAERRSAAELADAIERGGQVLSAA